VDFTELVEEVAAAQPDFVGFAGFNPEVALFYSQLRDADYNGPFGAGDAAASVETFVVPVGVAAAEGVYFSGCPLPLSEELRAEFESISDQPLETTGFVAHYADAARVLLDAVAAVAVEDENGSLIIDPVELRDAVAATNFDDGASGHIRFDDEGGRHTDAEPTDLAGQARDLGWTACQVRDGALTVSQ
jgi:ABC-type branched-subunit amino acid transport system substrate-binding protein